MQVLFSRPTPRATSRLKAARTLFCDGGLADYPGPAALLCHDGAVIAANGAARRWAAALGFETPGRLHPALATAIREGAPRRDTIEVVLPGTSGAVHFEYTVVPLVAGQSALMLGRDTTLERNLNRALTDSRQRYRDLARLSSDFIWETGADGRFVFVSAGGGAGFDAEALPGTSPAELLADPDTDAAVFSAREPVSELDLWMRRTDGGLTCFVTSAMPLFGEDGAWRGARGLCRDVTAMRGHESALARARARERLMGYIVRTVRDEIDPARMLEAAAAATARALAADACRIFRVNDDGARLLAASCGADIAEPEIEAGAPLRASPDGRPVTAEAPGCRLLGVATSYRERVNGALLLARTGEGDGWADDDRTLAADVALQLGIALAQLDNQLRLETLSRTDALTGLLNRRAFGAELAARLSRDGASGALVYVDLDNFKPVNDVLGHQKGDEALQAVARMLEKNTRPGDLVARLGGDEFALWLERAGEAVAAKRARALLAAARVLEPYSGDPERPLGISLGIAVARGEGMEALTRRADAAMYEIKRNGKAGYAIAAAPPPRERATA